MKNKKSVLVSTCCKAPIVYSNPAPDFIGDKEEDMVIGTCCCLCSKCQEPCNIMSIERKFWTRNPVTQIIPNKKKKSSTKLTPKELKEIHKNEDF